MKVKATLLVLCMFITLLTGCGKQTGTGNLTPTPTTAVTTAPSTAPTTAAPTTAATTAPTGTTPDVVTTASIVNTEDAFIKAISKSGTWIIAILNDMTINKDLVLDGDFKNSKGESERKLAFYSQDANRVVTARYTLKAPKLTINSVDARIQSGTFKGDVYVNAKNFSLVDAKVDGNVYFANKDAQSTFKMDATSSITGKQELVK
jgi:hypothetical protein